MNRIPRVRPPRIRKPSQPRPTQPRPTLRTSPTFYLDIREAIQRIHELRNEIDRHTDLIRLRRIIDYIGYVQARPAILEMRVDYTTGLHRLLLEWIHEADQEMGILHMMTTLTEGLTDTLRMQLMGVAHYEHIRENAIRLLVTCKDALKALIPLPQPELQPELQPQITPLSLIE